MSDSLDPKTPAPEHARDETKVVFAVASLIVLCAFVALFFVKEHVWLVLLDNLHWTVAYVAAAWLGAIGVRVADPASRPVRLWFTLGMIANIGGQLLWNYQVITGSTSFPGPSDLLFVLVGPCCALGFLAALRANIGRSQLLTAGLDAGALSVAVLAVTLALYLPRRGDLGTWPLILMVAYPVGLLTAACLGVILVPTLRMRINSMRGLFLLGLMVDGWLWMRWNSLSLDDALGDGTAFNALFSVTALGLGIGARYWRLTKTEDPVWERVCEGLLRQLPLLVVACAGVAVLLPWAMHGVSKAVQFSTGAAAVVMVVLAMARQIVLLTERDRMLEAEKQASESEVNFKTLFDTAADGIIIMDDRACVDCNPSALALFGVEKSDLIGQSLWRFSPACQPDGTRSEEKARTFVEAALAGRPQFFEWRNLRADGSPLDVEVRLNRIERGTGLFFQAVMRDITERKRTVELLHETEQRFRILVESAPEAIVVLDLEKGRFSELNENACRLFKMDRAQLMATGPIELSPPYQPDGKSSEDSAREKIERAIAGENPRFEWVHRDSAGDEISCEVYLTRLPSSEKILIRGSIIDITERKLAEDALQMMRFSVDRAVDSMFWLSREGKVLYVNNAACEGRGYSREELLKLDISDLNPSFEPGVWESYFETLKLQGSNTFETTHRAKDGRIFPVEVCANYVCLHGQEFSFSSLRDITERKRADSRFRRLAESNMQGVMFVNITGSITGANDAFLDLLGYDRGDLEAGRLNWLELTPPEYADLDRRNLEEMAAKGFCAPYEKEYTRKDGSRVPVLMGAAVFEDNPNEGVCFVLDLTERKALERQFLRAQRMESIGTLAGGIAHDLNNVLGPIIMSLDLLKLNFPDPRSAHLLEILGSSAQHGAEMVRQVLSFARGAEGRRVQVQIRHLVSEIERTVNDTFLKHIRMQVGIAPDLWTVTGDPTQLHQVLMNLCMNARDAMPGGGLLSISAENLTIGPRASARDAEVEPGSYVHLQVRDTGVGMSADVMEKIFDPFFTTKETGQGTGLGLSTSLAIIKGHGGVIQVSSEPGKGTKFRIYLPAKAGAAPSPVVEPPPGMPGGNGELILVVDDEASIRAITRQTLETFGYRVIVASDGLEAIAIFTHRSAEIAAVLTDMTMPLMDGSATIRELRRLSPKLPVVAVSGLSANNHAALSEGLGVEHFLPKPYTTRMLLTTLKQVLAGVPPTVE